MRIVCSWCRVEGQSGIVGDKAPLDDLRETHGICAKHRIMVQTRWKEKTCGSGVIGSQSMTAAPSSELFFAQAGTHLAMSAVQLWTDHRNLKRKTGL